MLEICGHGAVDENLEPGEKRLMKACFQLALSPSLSKV